MRKAAFFFTSLAGIVFAGPAAAEPLDPADFKALAPELDGWVQVNTDTGILRAYTSDGPVEYEGVWTGRGLAFTFGTIKNLSSGDIYTDYSGIHGSAPVIFLSHGDVTVGSLQLRGGYYGNALQPPPAGGGPGGGARGGEGGPSGLEGRTTRGFAGTSGGIAMELKGGEGYAYDNFGPRMGGGGGAIEIGALGTVTVQGTIDVSGGNGGPAQPFGSVGGAGGGGGGGAVLIHAQAIEVLGGIQANGGTGRDSRHGSGGGGGGGSVALLAGDGGIDIRGYVSVAGGYAEFGGESPAGEDGENGDVLLRSSGPIRGDNRVYGNVQVQVVPEPSAGLLALVGGLGLLTARRLRR